MLRRCVFACVALSVITACGPPAAVSSPSPPASVATLPSPIPVTGQDFAEDARLLYRVLACQGDAAIPTALDASVVKRHCAQMLPRIAGYRAKYLRVAAPNLAALRPEATPTTVVYPFGGGDLLSALTTYPEALEITTMSLEQAGDPRRLAGLDARRLAESLQLIEQTIAPLLALNDSTSENLMKGQRGDIPGQLGFFVVALAVHGFEPVSLRYFRIEDDGRLHYYERAEVEAGDDQSGRSLKLTWTPPDFAPVFANLELSFRRVGAAPGEPVRVHRHIGANLADGPLAKHPGLLKHLEAKGRVAAMTKAASYLLWRPDFGTLRKYLTQHLSVMISDSTGIPPSFAQQAGLQQETHGRFKGSFLPADRKINDQFRELWKAQPARPLPFRYGYLDASRSYHLLVTRRVAR